MSENGKGLNGMMMEKKSFNVVLLTKILTI